MTTTSHITVSATEWTELADGSENVTVQLITGGPIEVAVNTTSPTGTKDVGHILSHVTRDMVSFSGLAATDLVYAKSFNPSGASSVAVTKA